MDDPIVLNLETLRAEKETKVGMISAFAGIPAWGIILLTYQYFKYQYAVESTLGLVDIIVGPMLIVLTSIAMVYFQVARKLKIKSIYFTYMFMFFHFCWSTYLFSFAPQEINSYILMGTLTVGLIYLFALGGFWSTFNLSLLCLSTAIAVLYFKGLDFGMDEKIFFYFYSVMALWASGASEVLRRRMRQARIYKDELEGQAIILMEQHKKLEDVNSELRKVARDKTKFFQSVSHELRTPLTLIVNPLNSAKSDYPTDGNIAFAAKNAKRLHRLVNQLLDFQKVTNRNEEFNLAVINLVPFLEICAKYFEKVCEEKNVSFEYDLSKLEAVNILGEVDAIEKIVFNYLSNALKFTPDHGQIKMVLSSENGKAKIYFKDNGPGISEGNKANLFNVFSQPIGEENARNDGTGIGLALIKELSDKMNGTVGVDSHQGLGSVFWVEFPLYKKDFSFIDLLCVDDEIQAVFGLEKYIIENHPEFELAFAKSAKEARKVLERQKVRCVLSDLVMRDEDGISLLSYVAKNYPETGRLLMTGDREIELPQRAINDAKITEVFYKPLENSDVSKIINNVYMNNFKAADTFDASAYSPREWYLSSMLDEVKEEKVEDFLVNVDKDTESDGELVLIIDDLPDMRNLIASLLITEGYDILEANNGKSALEVIEKNRPDLIIVDWMMPVMDGPQFVIELRQSLELSAIPVIMLTAKSDEESKVLGEQYGVNAYIGKPFNECELLTSIKNLLTLKKREREILELNRHISENVLKRFLPPKLVEDIVSGKKEIDETPKILPVTVMFSDLCDFTRKSSILGPTLMLEIINKYLDKMSDVIFECGGNIDKFIGDSIMVIFGAPNWSNSSDQVRMAQNCAFKMQNALVELNREWSGKGHPEFSMRIGIHHGPAIVGYLGSSKRADYTAIGSTVNVASRIEGVAEEDSIYVSETVRDLLENVEWDNKGKFALKGIENEIPLYKLKTDKKKKAA